MNIEQQPKEQQPAAPVSPAAPPAGDHGEVQPAKGNERD